MRKLPVIVGIFGLVCAQAFAGAADGGAAGPSTASSKPAAHGSIFHRDLHASAAGIGGEKAESELLPGVISVTTGTVGGQEAKIAVIKLPAKLSPADRNEIQQNGYTLYTQSGFEFFCRVMQVPLSQVHAAPAPARQVQRGFQCFRTVIGS
jgi:hypothetical protein